MATDDEVEKKEAEDSSEEESEEEEASGSDERDEESSAEAEERASSDEESEEESEDEESDEESDEDEEEEEEAPKKAASKDSPKKAAAKSEPKKSEPAKKAAKSDDDEKERSEEAPVEIPTQLGHRRFVYAAYLAATIGIVFILNKALDYGWFKAASWKPEWFMSLGVEPRDEIIVPIAVIAGIALAYRYWRDLKVRTMAEEVAEELTKVTWPTRDEVQNSTTVVIITTIFATIFFALMDQFWLWVTKHVYGS